MSRSSTSRVPTIDRALVERTLAAARASPRRRQNHNFHDNESHPCQRLINAILPDAYIQPHRHLEPHKDEMLVILRGRAGLVFFDDAGEVAEKKVLAEGGEVLAANIPHGVFHTLVALGGPVVVFEAKAGPYRPHAPEERAPFAPAEDSPQARDYLARLRALFAGERGSRESR